MTKIQSILITILSAIICLAVIAAMQIWGNEAVPENAVLFGIFSVVDIIASIVVGLIVLYSINRAKQKRRK